MVGTRSERASWPRRLGLALGAFAMLLLAAELGFRWLVVPRLRGDGREGVPSAESSIQRARAWYVENRSEAYEPRAYVGFARPSSKPEVNELGFEGPEWVREKAPGTLRIVCLGGSTTASGNPLGLLGSYPYFLERRLRELSGRAVEVLNAGVSSWTTAEMLCAWFLSVQDFEPDLVILHEAVNDTEPRNWPGFRNDYSHYRVPWMGPQSSALQRWLISVSDLYAWRLERSAPLTIVSITVREPSGSFCFADGRFDSATAYPYRRNTLSIGRSAHAQGAHVLLATLPSLPHGGDTDFERRRECYRYGISAHNQLMREIASEEGWMLCDLEQQMLQLGEAGAPLFIDLVHVTPQGNDYKALGIARTLLAEWDALRADAPGGDAAVHEPAAPGD